MSILGIFDICLTVFIENRHQHQNRMSILGVCWHLFANSHRKCTSAPKCHKFRPSGYHGCTYLIPSFNLSLRMSILGDFWHLFANFVIKRTPVLKWCESGPSSQNGCDYLILSFKLSLRMSVFGDFDICLSVFIENGYQHQNKVNLDLLHKMTSHSQHQFEPYKKEIGCFLTFIC
jgi:hypothetical protein